MSKKRCAKGAWRRKERVSRTTGPSWEPALETRMDSFGKL